MSGSRVKAERVISIQARRAQREFERVAARLAVARAEAAIKRRARNRAIAAWVGLTLLAVLTGTIIVAGVRT